MVLYVDDIISSSTHLSAHTCEVSHAKRSRLLSQLALPYNRLASRTPSRRSLKKVRRVFPRTNGLESELSSDVSSDITDVTSDISSVPTSPRVLKNIEQGTLGVVVRGHEGWMLGSVLTPRSLSFLPSSHLSSFSCDFS